MKVQALLLTHNEEAHIGACIDSLHAHGITRIVVVDSGSTDRTLEIVGGRAEVHHRPFDNFSGQRNHGLDNYFTRDTWVLHLDADERLTPRLAREIARLSPGPRIAYNIPSLTYFRGRPIPRASGYPVYQTRLTLAGPFRFIEVGHGQKAPPDIGPIPRLRAPYHHHPFDKGMSDWVARHDRYSAREAAEWAANARRYSLRQAIADPIARRQWLKQLARRIPAAPLLTYAWLMFIKGGILEGQPGRDYCRMRLIYENLVVLKYHELQQARGKEGG